MGVRTAETMTGVVLSDTGVPGWVQAGKIGGRAAGRYGGRGVPVQHEGRMNPGGPGRPYEVQYPSGVSAKMISANGVIPRVKSRTL